MKTCVASIIHGAYGDCYEQLLCLKRLSRLNPDWSLKLYFATRIRREAFDVLDLSFADRVGHWREMEEDRIDFFHQFQVFDKELKHDVIQRLPKALKSKIDLNRNLLPWRMLPALFPPGPEEGLALSEKGRELLPKVMAENGIGEEVFQLPTLGFLWRYRKPEGEAISPLGQPGEEELRAKYSRVFNRLIEETGCRVLVCGMKVSMKGEERDRLDNKYPEFGLDLPPDKSVHLKGLNFVLEAAILARADACLCHASGFSECVNLMKPQNVFLVDPPLIYLLKMIKYRMPFYGCLSARGLARAWLRPHSEKRIRAWLRPALLRD